MYLAKHSRLLITRSPSSLLKPKKPNICLPCSCCSFSVLSSPNRMENINPCRPTHSMCSSVLKERNVFVTRESNRRQFLVAIEGNIGAGKSTLLKHLSKNNDVDICMEPVEDWCNVNGTNMLELLYSDPRRWCFAFNSNAMLARMKMHCDATSYKPVRLIERSLYATRHVFVEQSRQAGNILDIEFAMLDELFHSLKQYCNVHLDRIVYLRASPDVCLERIKRRGRKEETGLSLEFLTSLHDLYDNWLLNSKTNIPVVTIDADRNLSDSNVNIYDAVCGTDSVSVLQ